MIKKISSIKYILFISLAFCPSAIAGDIEKRIFTIESRQDQETIRKSYTLTQAVERALLANPNLDTFEMQVKAARYDVRNAYSGFVPTVVASGSAMYTNGTSWYSNYTTNVLGALNAGLNSTTWTNLPDIGTADIDQINLSWTVAAVQPIFPLTMLSQLEASKLAEDSYKLQYENASLQLISAVQSTFINYLHFNAMMKTTEGAIARANEQLAVTRAQYKLGLRRKLDVLQAEVDLANLENSLIQVKDQRELVRASLQALLALPVTSTIEFSGSLEVVPFTKTLEECLELAMQNRPELKLGRLAVNISETGEKIARAGFYPQLSLQGSYSETGDNVKEAGDTRIFAIGLSAQWEVFSGGRTINNTSKAKLETSKAVYALMDSTNHVANSVKSLYFSVHEARKRIDVTEQALAKAKESYRAAQMTYQVGNATNLDLLYAQLALTNEEQNHSAALADYLRAIAQLYTAMGDTYIITIE